MYLEEYCLESQYRCKLCWKLCGTANIHRNPNLKYHISAEEKQRLCVPCWVAVEQPPFGIDKDKFFDTFYDKWKEVEGDSMWGGSLELYLNKARDEKDIRGENIAYVRVAPANDSHEIRALLDNLKKFIKDTETALAEQDRQNVENLVVLTNS